MSVPAEESPFTQKDLEAMQTILADPHPVHDSDPNSARVHVEHCLWQLARFAHIARLGCAFRAVQFGLNLGRAQELLKSHGGLAAWWRAFEPLIVEGRYQQLEEKAGQYLKLLGLRAPPEEFINRV